MPRAKANGSKKIHAPAARRATRTAARPKARVESTTEPEPANDVVRARAFWSGTLSFGLVSIPVDLHPAIRSAGVSMRMLAPDGTPLSRRYFCPEEDREVPEGELTRGYEHAPGEYVVVEDDELEALAPDKSRDIDLRRFVDADSIEPAYFERAYVLAPTGDSNKAYRLLVDVMDKRKVAGIATIVLRDREHVIAIFSQSGLLRAQTLRFVDELRPLEGVGVPPESTADAASRREYRAVLRHMGKHELDPKTLADDSAEALRAVAERKKQRGDHVFVQETASEAGAEGAEVIDLLQVLKRSLSDKSPAKSR